MENNIILTQIHLDELKTIISNCLRDELNKGKEIETSSSDQLIKVDDAVKLFKVSKVTLYKWRVKGILPFHRISSRIYFKKDEIMSALKASKRIKI
ncbi:MAG: Helix-turn-helix domain [Bacteroidota bacterium]|jgi:hypothetical protein|nr:Helix-turn-helix domain [Bacteroidota bacterium]